MMNKLLILLFLFVAMVAQAQFLRDEVLHLHNGTTADIAAMTNKQTEHIIHNSTTNTLWHNDGRSWLKINKVTPTVYVGFIINAKGSQSITSLPFQPSQITFVAHANVKSLNIDRDKGIKNNDNTLQNSFGTMHGFTINDGACTTQQVIYIDGNVNSINNIFRYSSSANCIGSSYRNQNGDEVEKITTAASSENLVVLYTTYK